MTIGVTGATGGVGSAVVRHVLGRPYPRVRRYPSMEGVISPGCRSKEHCPPTTPRPWTPLHARVDFAAPAHDGPSDPDLQANLPSMAWISPAATSNLAVRSPRRI
jgi:hypothetical protein